jgi:hypothetical protein
MVLSLADAVASDMLQTKMIGKVPSWPIISDGSRYATIHLSLAER